MYLNYKFLLLITLTIILSACNKKSDELWNAERAEIRAYLSDKGITDYTENQDAGYFYYFTDLDSLKPGRPNTGSVVEVKYKGSFFNGNLFYETATGVTDFVDLSNTIYGWQLGLQNFRNGSKGILILPSRLAYGEKGLYDETKNILIPPYSILVFEIELVEIHPHF